MDCTPVSYNYKNDLRRGRNNTQFGYIAQDLEKKGYPWLVTHVTSDDKDLIEIIDEDGYKSEEGIKLTIS